MLPVGREERAIIRFGSFELDSLSGELRKHGVKLKLAAQTCRVLRVLLETPGHVVTREYLKRCVWPGQNAADFDNGINKCISQLRTILGDGGPSPRYIETLPKRGYRFIAPIADALPSEQLRERAVAVLPFENLTGDPSLAYIAEGISDALTTGLGVSSNICVIARTSAKAAVMPGKSLRDIGHDLRVSTVVEGSVIRSGTLRVNVRIASIDSDKLVWQGKYECKPESLLTLCDRLTEVVRIAITGAKPQHRELPDSTLPSGAAHLSYLKGRYFWNKRTEQDLNRSIDAFNDALQIEPDFALAHSGLADAYILRDIWALESPRSAFRAARNYAERAIELDGNLAEAHTCRAEVMKDYDWDFRGAETEFRHAIALNPNYSTAHHYYAQLLVSLGRFDEAIAEIEFARRVDPLAPSINAYVPYIFLAARDYTRAVKEGQRAVELEPYSPMARWQLGRALLFAKEYHRAVQELGTASGLANRRTMWEAELCFALARSGDRTGAEAIRDRLMALAEQSWMSPYDLAVCAAGLNDASAALDHLERALQDRVMRVIGIGDPEFDELRGEPRLIHLVRTLRLPTLCPVPCRES